MTGSTVRVEATESRSIPIQQLGCLAFHEIALKRWPREHRSALSA